MTEERIKPLEVSEEKYSNLMKNSPDLICVVDRESTKIVDINDAVFNILGYSKDEIIGSLSSSCIVPSQRDEYTRKLEGHNKNEEFSGEFDVQKKDGSLITLEVSGSSFGNYLFAFGRDVTKRKQARKEAEFYVDLMSHDINNANTVAMGMLELLIDTPDPGEQKDQIQKAIKAIGRSANIIENVRKAQLAKLNGKSSFAKRSLHQAIDDAIEDVKNFHVDKSVTINYTPTDAQVFTDTLLRDLFRNLLDNAVKYDLNSEVEIDIDVIENEAENLVKVVDRGMGISDEMKVAMFERFKRGNSGVDGSGIGLYLCRLLINKYQGRIWVENRVDGDHKKGSVFNVALPKA